MDGSRIGMRMRALLVLLLLASLGLSGCTDSSDETPEVDDSTPDGSDGETPMDTPTQGSVLSIAAVGAYPFNPALDPPRFEVKAGSTVSITYTNDDMNPLVGHDLRISGVDEQTPNLANGESAELTFVVDLEPGEYPYWCTIGNHREQGMEGVMVVV